MYLRWGMGHTILVLDCPRRFVLCVIVRVVEKGIFGTR